MSSQFSYQLSSKLSIQEPLEDTVLYPTTAGVGPVLSACKVCRGSEEQESCLKLSIDYLLVLRGVQHMAAPCSYHVLPSRTKDSYLAKAALLYLTQMWPPLEKEHSLGA